MKDNKNITVMAWRDMWHPKVGGAEIYIMRMIENLRDNGYNIKYITARYKGSKKTEIKDEIEYVRIGNSITLYILAPLFYLLNLKRNTDLLIENFNAVPFNIPIYNKRNITIIHHLQDSEWVSAYGKIIGKLSGFFFTKLTSFVYRNEKNIVTVSPSSKEDLISKGFKEENVSIIYNGIDTKVINKIEKDTKNINILSLGRVMPTKHIDEAIEMINYTVKELKIKNIVLNIAGKGDDENRLRSIVKEKGLDDYVKFLGFVSVEQKDDLLNKAHLHVQFSRKEGWGITVIEAASKGTPTICYPVPGLIDSVTDKTGYFIRTSLKETWEDIIIKIKNNDTEYINKQKNCLEWAKKFEWDYQRNIFLEYLRSNTIENTNNNDNGKSANR